MQHLASGHDDALALGEVQTYDAAGRRLRAHR